MEGRTKFNYGYNSGLITMKDINYMFNIINSNLSEEEKAIKLSSNINDVRYSVKASFNPLPYI